MVQLVSETSLIYIIDNKLEKLFEYLINITQPVHTKIEIKIQNLQSVFSDQYPFGFENISKF